MIEYPAKNWFDALTKGFSNIAMFLIAIIVAVMICEVVMRYGFGKPTLWANELSLWLAGGVYLLSGIYAMQQRSHIRIVMLYDQMPLLLQYICDIITLLFMWLLIGAVIWGGYGEAYAKFMRWETFGTAWDPPIPATTKPLALIVIVLLGLQMLSNLITDFKAKPLFRGKGRK